MNSKNDPEGEHRNQKIWDDYEEEQAAADAASAEEIRALEARHEARMKQATRDLRASLDNLTKILKAEATKHPRNSKSNEEQNPSTGHANSSKATDFIDLTNASDTKSNEQSKARPPSILDSTSLTLHATAQVSSSSTPSATRPDPTGTKKRPVDSSDGDVGEDDDCIIVREKRRREMDPFTLEPFNFRHKLPQNWFIQIPSTSLPVNESWGNDLWMYLSKYSHRRVKADTKAWYVDFGDCRIGRDRAKECFDDLVGKKFNNHVFGMRLYGFTPTVSYQLFRSTLEDVEVDVEIPGKQWWDRP